MAPTKKSDLRPQLAFPNPKKAPPILYIPSNPTVSRTIYPHTPLNPKLFPLKEKAVYISIYISTSEEIKAKNAVWAACANCW